MPKRSDIKKFTRPSSRGTAQQEMSAISGGSRKRREPVVNIATVQCDLTIDPTRRVNHSLQRNCVKKRKSHLEKRKHHDRNREQTKKKEKRML